MQAKELIAKVRKLEIKTRRTVDEITGGAYHSVFKGRGIEFSEVREYSPGDDVRDIDWNVTARTGTPFIKKYSEERELTVILVVDCSASFLYGSGASLKRESAAEVAALLAFNAIRNKDKAGLLLFSDRTELYLPPKQGTGHGLRLIRELLAFEPTGKKTSLNHALEEILKTVHKKAVIFLISDFMTPENIEKNLTAENKRHNLVTVRLSDKCEKNWTLPANINLEDMESGRNVFYPGASGKMKTAYKEAADANRQRLEKLCKKAAIDLIDIENGEDPARPFTEFFNRRKKIRR